MPDNFLLGFALGLIAGGLVVVITAAWPVRAKP